MADDLEAFLRDEPISARSTSLWALASRLLARNAISAVDVDALAAKVAPVSTACLIALPRWKAWGTASAIVLAATYLLASNFLSLTNVQQILSGAAIIALLARASVIAAPGNSSDPNPVTLGEKIFSDARLSASGAMSPAAVTIGATGRLK